MKSDRFVTESAWLLAPHTAFQEASPPCPQATYIEHAYQIDAGASCASSLTLRSRCAPTDRGSAIPYQVFHGRHLAAGRWLAQGPAAGRHAAVRPVGPERPGLEPGACFQELWFRRISHELTPCACASRRACGRNSNRACPRRAASNSSRAYVLFSLGYVQLTYVGKKIARRSVRQQLATRRPGRPALGPGAFRLEQVS